MQPYQIKKLFKTILLLAIIIILAITYYYKFVRSATINSNQPAIATSYQINADTMSRLKAATPDNFKNLVWLQHPLYIGDINFKDASDAEVNLKSLKEPLLLVNLWASWCVPCRVEIPDLDKLIQANISSNFKVVAINIDNSNPDKFTRFLQQVGAEHIYPYRDRQGAIFETLKVNGLALGLPVTMIVNQQRYVIAIVNGALEWSSPEAIELLKQAEDLLKPKDT